MRDFTLEDAYRAWDLLDAAGFDDKKVENILASVQESAEEKGEIDLKSIGIKSITKVMRAFAEKGAREPMYEFLSGPFEKTPEEMKNAPITEIVEGVKWLAKEGFLKNFLSSLAATDTK